MRKQAGERREKVANDTTVSGFAAEKARYAAVMGRVLAASDKPAKPRFKGAVGERIEARKRSREFHPLDDSPYENLGGGEAGDFKKKKGDLNNCFPESSCPSGRLCMNKQISLLKYRCVSCRSGRRRKDAKSYQKTGQIKPPLIK